MPTNEHIRSKDAPTTDPFADGLSILENLFAASQHYFSGLSRYTSSFYMPYFLATQYFQRVEALRLLEQPPAKTMDAYLGLLENNIELMARSLNGSADLMEGLPATKPTDSPMPFSQLLMDGNPAKLVSIHRPAGRIVGSGRQRLSQGHRCHRSRVWFPFRAR
jgi:hypothetical protein